LCAEICQICTTFAKRDLPQKAPNFSSKKVEQKTLAKNSLQKYVGEIDPC